MKLKEFEINIGGAMVQGGDVPELSDEILDLKIKNVIGEEYEEGAMFELEDGKKLFVRIKDDDIVQKQCLGEILVIIQRSYLGKALREIIDRDFCEAGRIE